MDLVALLLLLSEGNRVRIGWELQQPVCSIIQDWVNSRVARGTTEQNRSVVSNLAHDGSIFLILAFTLGQQYTLLNSSWNVQCCTCSLVQIRVPVSIQVILYDFPHSLHSPHQRSGQVCDCVCMCVCVCVRLLCDRKTKCIFLPHPTIPVVLVSSYFISIWLERRESKKVYCFNAYVREEWESFFFLYRHHPCHFIFQFTPLNFVMHNTHYTQTQTHTNTLKAFLLAVSLIDFFSLGLVRCNIWCTLHSSRNVF